MESLVSIITPAYNCQEFIEQTLISVRNQTYQNWEHIIVDDGSTDATMAIVESYAKMDGRIHVITLQQNGGVAKARNVGIDNARGEYIAFLDSDDQWKEDKLEKHMQFIKENNLKFSYTEYEVIDEVGNYIKTIVPARNKVNYQQLLYTNVIACCTVIVESRIMKEEKMPEIKHEDYAAWLNILHNNNIEAVCLQKALSVYRKVRNSVSANKWKTIDWNWNIYYNNQKLGFWKSLKYITSFIVLTGIKYLKK